MTKAHHYRIISGIHKGLQIPIPQHNQLLRASTDRTRETLFNWLMHAIYNKKCLDLFAGSGALAFEAVSRGASQTTVCENNHKTCAHLKSLIQKHAFSAHVHQQCAIDYIKQCKKQFDVIFLDPPFQSNLLMQCLEHISPACHAKSLIYAEHNQNITNTLPSYLSCLKYRKIGSVHAHLLTHQS